MIFLGDRIFIMELARGSFQDENSVPSCKKYHSLAHASKNLYIIIIILIILIIVIIIIVIIIIVIIIIIIIIIVIIIFIRRRLLDLLVPGSFPDHFYRVGREVIKNKVDFFLFF